jgi:glycosyltransferase involved in cell wall biosynthesis
MASDREKPKLSIVVPSRSFSEVLSLLSNLCLCEDIEKCEIIVVLDGFVADQELEKYLATTPLYLMFIVAEKTGAIGALRNLGVEVASAPNVYFLDTDCSFDKHLINIAMSASGAPVVRGSVSFKAEKGVWAKMDSAIRTHRYSAQPSAVAYCPNLLISRDMFKMTGGFDERYKYGSDGAFATSLAKHSIPVDYKEQLNVQHVCHGGGIAVMKKWYDYGLGRALRRDAFGGSIVTLFPERISTKHAGLLNTAIIFSSLLRISAFIYFLGYKSTYGLPTAKKPTVLSTKANFSSKVSR